MQNLHLLNTFKASINNERSREYKYLRTNAGVKVESLLIKKKPQRTANTQHTHKAPQLKSGGLNKASQTSVLTVMWSTTRQFDFL